MIRLSILLLAIGVALSACNTVEGVGADISGSARAVKNTF
jgi:predicted small secreted protein